MPTPAPVVLTDLDIARAAYAAYRATLALDAPDWPLAPDWVRGPVLGGVRFRLARPGGTLADQHGRWVADMTVLGWTYGPQVDPAALTHPAMLPYANLSPEWQAFFRLLGGVTDALRPALPEAWVPPVLEPLAAAH